VSLPALASRPGRERGHRMRMPTSPRTYLYVCSMYEPRRCRCRCRQVTVRTSSWYCLLNAAAFALDVPGLWASFVVALSNERIMEFVFTDCGRRDPKGELKKLSYRRGGGETLKVLGGKAPLRSPFSNLSPAVYYLLRWGTVEYTRYHRQAARLGHPVHAPSET